MSSSDELFEFYKPLRNNLSKVCLEESLYVVWAYIQHIIHNSTIPPDIEVAQEFLRKSHRGEKGIFAWEFELIARETIVNAQQGDRCPETLKQWSYLRRSIGKVRDLENAVGQMYVDHTNALTELNRIAHRQFQWQNYHFMQQLTRNYKIFSYPDIDRIVQEKLNLSVYQLYLIGFSLFSFYYKTPAVRYPITVSLAQMNQESVETFLRYFSRDLDSIRAILMSEQDISERYAYSFSSLRAYPLIKMPYRNEMCLVCPLPPLLLWRITTGLYYEIVRVKGFGASFGKSYQNHVGEVLEKANIAKKLTIVPEHEYYVGHDRKDTIDWIAHDDQAALFIECKTKRLVLPAKVELLDTKPMEEELETMSDFIVQIYRTISDYANDCYPNFKFNSGREVYPFLVTLEDWYLFGGGLHSDLRRQVEDKFRALGLSLDMLDKMPYSICSIDELEDLMQVIQVHGIKEVVTNKVHDGEKKTWSVGPYLMNSYKADMDRVNYLFKDEFQELFGRMARSVS